MLEVAGKILEVQSKMASRISIVLSKAARVTMILSPTANIPIYFMSSFQTSVSISMRILESQGISYGGSEDEKDTPWPTIGFGNLPKKMEGLGLRKDENMGFCYQSGFGEWLVICGTLTKHNSREVTYGTRMSAY